MEIVLCKGSAYFKNKFSQFDLNLEECAGGWLAYYLNLILVPSVAVTNQKTVTKTVCGDKSEYSFVPNNLLHKHIHNIDKLYEVDSVKSS